jgi:hypothetical protein
MGVDRGQLTVETKDQRANTGVRVRTFTGFLRASTAVLLPAHYLCHLISSHLRVASPLYSPRLRLLSRFAVRRPPAAISEGEFGIA